MRIFFPGSHHGSNSTPSLVNHNCFAGKPNLELMMMGGLIHHSMVSHNNASAFLYQLHKVPIICAMMEYSTLHLSIIIIIFNKWKRIHCKEENRKFLFLFFCHCKTKGYQQNQILAQYWFHLSTCRLPS